MAIYRILNVHKFYKVSNHFEFMFEPADLQKESNLQDIVPFINLQSLLDTGMAQQLFSLKYHKRCDSFCLFFYIFQEFTKVQISRTLLICNRPGVAGAVLQTAS